MKTILTLLVFLTTLLPTRVSAQAAAVPASLTALRCGPENTIILDGSDYAGRVLQYYLIRGCMGSEAAQAYLPDAKSDRAASAHFKLLPEKAGTQIPDDKIILAVISIVRYL